MRNPSFKTQQASSSEVYPTLCSFTVTKLFFQNNNFPVVNLEEINTICMTCNDLLFVCVISSGLERFA